MIKKTLSVKGQVIKRLNEGFGFSLPLDVRWRTHQKAFKDEGGLSWYIFSKVGSEVHRCEEVGSCDSTTKCLSYDRWVISPDNEISQYFESEKDFYEKYDYLIEKK